jgi:alkanesulfonate monooxygenase SsuD/methylene tetrahydromethanopterin reductase-like flavin-dependent oxidoreductase (luciferase family)
MGSPETIEWAAQHRYTYAACLVPMDATVRLYDAYREYASATGYTATADHLAYMVCDVCADTDEKAREVGKHYRWRMGHPLRGPAEYWAPPGYAEQRKPVQPGGVSRHGRKPMYAMTYEELQESDHLAAGSPRQCWKNSVIYTNTLALGRSYWKPSRGDAPCGHRALAGTFRP